MCRLLPRHLVGGATLRAIALTLALPLLGVALTAATQQTTIVPILERYLAGRHEAAVAEAAAMPQAQLATVFGRDAKAWVASASSPDDQTRRRLAAATFALEVGYATQPPTDPGWDAEWWYTKVLIEHACILLRAADDVHPVERAWFLASFILIKGAADEEFLVGSPPRQSAFDRQMMTRDAPARPPGIQYLSPIARPERDFAARSGVAVDHHLADALDRVDDPRLRLAVATDSTFPSAQMRGFLQGFGAPRANPAVERVISRLVPLREYAEIRSTVDLYLGFATLVKNDVETAARLFSTVAASSTDPVERYLSWFFLGQISERQGHSAEALSHYQRAAGWRPYSSAALPLAALLLIDGQHTEAIAVAEAAVTLEHPEEDPVALFGRGDVWRWPQYLAALRSAFR